MICIRTSVSTEKSVPKIVDDDKIAVAMYVMQKMELLLSSELRKSRYQLHRARTAPAGAPTAAHAADLGESHTHQVAEVPICSVSASAFSLVASRPTPKFH